MERTTGSAGGGWATTSPDAGGHRPPPLLTVLDASAAALRDAELTSLCPHGRRLGCYVHLPFCVVRCGYCSFNTAPYTPAAMSRFMSALIMEIDLIGAAVSRAGEVTLRSVFFGGGT